MEDNIESDKSIEEEVKYSYNDIFYEKFQTLLINVGLTQSRLAEKLGTTRQYVWRVAHNLENPTNAMKIKIAQALETDTLCIWGNYDGNN